jgi:hypothetical protein
MDRPRYRSGREGIDAGPDKTSQAKTRGRATDLPPVSAWRTTEQVRHADAQPAKAGRAPQAWAAGKIDSPAPLSELRAEKEEIQGGHAELFFADYLRLKFPESYPADFVAAAVKAGVEVASLDEGSAREWNRKYEAARALPRRVDSDIS